MQNGHITCRCILACDFRGVGVDDWGTVLDEGSTNTRAGCSSNGHEEDICPRHVTVEDTTMRIVQLFFVGKDVREAEDLGLSEIGLRCS